MSGPAPVAEGFCARANTPFPAARDATPAAEGSGHLGPLVK